MTGDSTPLPTVGAAMLAETLEVYCDWIVADQRDLELQDPISPEVLDGDWRPLVQQVRSLLAGYRGRLGIHGPFLGISLMAPDPKICAVVSSRMCTALEIAGELGATHMVIHSPFHFFGHPLVAHTRSRGRASDIAMVHTTLEDVLPVAERVGCALVIETIQDRNPAPLLDLVASFASDYVQMSIDTGHVMIGHRLGGPPPEQWIAEAGLLLGHVHLQDSDGYADRHWAPGKGDINWGAIFGALRRLKHQPRLILEIASSELEATTRWLEAQGLAR